jgi:hypothetical protein
VVFQLLVAVVVAMVAGQTANMGGMGKQRLSPFTTGYPKKK